MEIVGKYRNTLYQKNSEVLNRLLQVSHGVAPELQRLKNVPYTQLKTVSGIWTLEQQWRPMDQQKKKKKTAEQKLWRQDPLTAQKSQKWKKNKRINW